MNTDGLLDKLEQALKTEKGDLDRRVAIYNRIGCPGFGIP